MTAVIITRKHWMMAFFVIGSLSGIAQSDSCSCRANLDDLIGKVEENYIAWHQKIKHNPAGRAQYDAFVEYLRRKAVGKTPRLCTGLLKEYTGYFHDGHLFVFDNPEYSSDELKRFRLGIQSVDLTEAQAKQYFDHNRSKLDPIEGIWYTDKSAYKLAIIRDSRNSNRFRAIVLASANPAWRPGTVKAVFTRKGGEYLAEYYAGNFGLRDYECGVHKSCVLNIGALIDLGKSYPHVADEQKYLDEENAMLPTITRLDESNILISVPSFLVERAYLDSLIKAHRQEVVSTPNLIIDIRGNGGGNGIYGPLLDLYATRPYQDSQGLALSSPNNVRYYRLLAGYDKDTANSKYMRVAHDMEMHPGEIVKGPLWRLDSGATAGSYPSHVAIITDRACASAAESFILASKGVSDRVTTFGERTFGMIDYTSVTILGLLCPKQNFLMGYPTGTLNSRIPFGGYNATGILPDVRISNDVRDKVKFVQAYWQSR